MAVLGTTLHVHLRDFKDLLATIIMVSDITHLSSQKALSDSLGLKVLLVLFLQYAVSFKTT